MKIEIGEEFAATLAGFVAGVLNALAVGPLDVVKARQQIQRNLITKESASSSKSQTTNSVRYQGTINSLIRIHKEEGIRGLYRGFQPTLIGYAPAWAIYFTCYNKGRDKLKQNYPNLSKDIIVVISAVGSGAIANTVTNPIWVIRTRLQTQEHVQRKPEYHGTFDAARTILKKEGYLAFYKGMVPSMWGLIHVAVQFPLYEKLKLFLNIHDDQKKIHLSIEDAAKLILASSTAKLIASLSTYPLEVIRTRMQVQRSDGKPPHYSTLFGSFRMIIKEEGVRGLYAGLATNLLRVVPACAITFTTYEVVHRELLRLQSIK